MNLLRYIEYVFSSSSFYARFGSVFIVCVLYGVLKFCVFNCVKLKLLNVLLLCVMNVGLKMMEMFVF